ncbi:MAG: hexitol phosphatase HxpB [Cryomorphaceae bacterium]|jgi:HAD superfamily hydrolase (TIGR01509 family)|nr:hexitol phosphatase HxpB [Cryomorphaceae bacterium]
MLKIDKLPLLNDYDAIIFDMDGVLIDSEPLWKIAMEFVFGQYGSTLTHQDFQKTVGLRIDEVIAFWNIQENWGLSDLKNVENQIIDKLISLIELDPKPLPGVLDTLQFLKESGKKIGLATSSSQRLITTVLRALHIESYFDFAYSAEFETYGKPHPGVYIKVAAHIAVPTQRCLVVEDSLNGIIAGLAAQMKVCCIPEKTHFPNPKLTVAHFQFTDLHQLLATWR